MLLSQANIGHSLIETEYRGHAAELGNALDQIWSHVIGARELNNEP